jgi:transcriptional antiterminator RfaH
MRLAGWACAQTHPNDERRAAREIEKQGFEVNFPTITERRLVRGALDDVPQPLFPCYLFVMIPDLTSSPWRAINSTRGVCRLLMSPSLVPLFISDAEVRRLPWLAYHATRPMFDAGTTVRVRRIDSSFYHLEGRALEMTKHDRVAVLMSMFQRDLVVEFSPHELETVK